MRQLLNAARPYDGTFARKAEEWLCRQFPGQIEEGWYSGIHLGRNKDAQVTQLGGFKTTGAQFQNSAIYFEVPDRILDAELVANQDALKPTFAAKIDPVLERTAVAGVQRLVKGGMDLEEAKAKVADAMPKIGYFNKDTGMYTVEPVAKATHDSILSGMEVPFWNVSRIQKIYRMPILRGYAEHLVSKVGVPNIWADFIQLYTAGYEGKARISSVAHTAGEHNTAARFMSNVGTMLSEVINLVIDYESPTPQERRLQGREGWLVGQMISDRDVYAHQMLEQLGNILLYFGHGETLFAGLSQIADRDGRFDYYPSDRAPASYMWAHDGATGEEPVNTTVGADLLLMLYHFIADRLEAMHFLPLTIKVSCAPVLWKALTFSMTSKVYNQNSPLSIINTAVHGTEKFVGTLVTRAGKGLWSSFELVPDPMLAPRTPFNDTDEDLMIMTFPTLQSEMGDQTDLVMAPVLIDKMVLPVAPSYRDGQSRTALRRIGSLLCPIAHVVHVLSGMGTNKRYTPPAPSATPWVRFQISGTITLDNPAGPAEGASVQLKQSGVNVGEPVLADATGAFAVTGVLTGVYTLEVSFAGYVTAEIAAFSVNSNVSGKDLELATV
jgi:hypothetical protein